MSVYDINGVSIGGSSVFVNVKDFGATGNGYTNDATAIQSAIDSIKASGGTVFFPVGTYVVNSIIRFYSNQHLIFDRNTTLKSGVSLNGLLIGYMSNDVEGYDGLQNVIIEGGKFERGATTGSSTLIGFSHAKNVIVKNAIIKSTGAWHSLEFNSTQNGSIENCVFDGTDKTSSSGCLVQLDSFAGEGSYPWDNVGAIDNTICDGIEIKSCRFENCSAAPFIGAHSNSGKNARIHDCTFYNNTSSRGAIQFTTLSNLDVYNNTFTDCTNGISFDGGGYSSCAVYNNRFTGATTAIASNIAEQYDNWINGTFVP